MSIPDYQSLMLPVLALSSKGEIRIGDAVDRLARQFSLTPEERAELLPSGKQTLFGNRVHWAKTYLAKAGLIESTRRGHFRITERGRSALSAHPPRIDNAFLSQFDEFQQFKERARASQTRPAPEAATSAGEAGLGSQMETPMRSCGLRISRSTRRLHRICSTAFARHHQSFFSV